MKTLLCIFETPDAGTLSGCGALMRTSSLPFSFGSLTLSAALLAATVGCVDGGSGDGDEEEEEDLPGRSAFAWVEVDSAVSVVWGAIVAESDDGAILVGGVANDQGPVLPTIERIEARDDDVVSGDFLAMETERFCGCAFVDEARRELVVIGGRDGAFRDINNAEIINLDDGSVSVLDGVAPAETPIGCQAFVVPSTQTAYVFSGLSSTQGRFGGTLYRYDGAARSFSAVDLDGSAVPAGRYDGTVAVLDDDRVLILGGMGLTGLGRPLFHQDGFIFDGRTETFSALDVSSSTALPEGRRYAFSAYHPTSQTLIYGLGSDSAQGLTQLGDMWSLNVSTGEWTELDVDNADAVGARGFAFRLPGPTGSAGFLTGGIDGAMALQTTTFALMAPTAMADGWR